MSGKEVTKAPQRGTFALLHADQLPVVNVKCFVNAFAFIVPTRSTVYVVPVAIGLAG
jgi:hypothetical protein